jgi:two-component system response regulator DesR
MALRWSCRAINTSVPGAIKIVMTLSIPTRVFLLSRSRFLSEALGRVLRKATDILIVGASPYSVGAPAEIAESTCDVLLTDLVSVLALDSQIPDNLQSAFSKLKVIVIDLYNENLSFSKLKRLGVAGYVVRDAAVADVISAIRVGVKREAVDPPQLPVKRCRGGVLTLGHTAP